MNHNKETLTFKQKTFIQIEDPKAEESYRVKLAVHVLNYFVAKALPQKKRYFKQTANNANYNQRWYIQTFPTLSQSLMHLLPQGQ